jgi:hypothetical protein
MNFPAVPGSAGRTPFDPLYPPANVRLMAKNTVATRVYFQYQPQDGALMEYVDVGHTEALTLDGNGALFDLTGADTETSPSTFCFRPPGTSCRIGNSHRPRSNRARSIRW